MIIKNNKIWVLDIKERLNLNEEWFIIVCYFEVFLFFKEIFIYMYKLVINCYILGQFVLYIVKEVNKEYILKDFYGVWCRIVLRGMCGYVEKIFINFLYIFLDF